MSHNKESLKKILFYFLITVGLVFSSTSYAGLNPNSWTELCDTNNEGEKVNCSIGVNSLMTASDGKQNVRQMRVGFFSSIGWDSKWSWEMFQNMRQIGRRMIPK